MSPTQKQDGNDHLSASRAGSRNTGFISQTLYIIVNRGDPIDSYSLRHTAFWVEFSDGRNFVSQVCGAASFFEFEERWNEAQPEENGQFERIIPVITVRTMADDMSIRDTLRGTPVNNDERSWNCQTWIGDGLKRLQDAKLLRETHIINAADQMVDVLLEAPDDD